MSNVRRVLTRLTSVEQLRTIELQDQDFHRVYGSHEHGLRVSFHGRTYRCVTWVGATHYRDKHAQVWMHGDDFRRNGWVEVRP